MPQAEGKTLHFDSPDTIDASALETFEYAGSPQLIEYRTAEFSAVCPFSGLPDIGTLLVEYIPGERIVELKSLKYYILAYRNVGIYQEHATDRMFRDLLQCLQPHWLRVQTIYNTRGGIDTTCTCEAGEREYRTN